MNAPFYAIKFVITKYRITNIPSTIRYHPNTLKSCFLIYPSKNLMANIDTINAVIIPNIRITISLEVKLNPNPSNLIKLAPNMTGMDKKKLNSAAI